MLDFCRFLRKKIRAKRNAQRRLEMGEGSMPRPLPFNKLQATVYGGMTASNGYANPGYEVDPQDYGSYNGSRSKGKRGKKKGKKLKQNNDSYSLKKGLSSTHIIFNAGAKRKQKQTDSMGELDQSMKKVLSYDTSDGASKSQSLDRKAKHKKKKSFNKINTYQDDQYYTGNRTHETADIGASQYDLEQRHAAQGTPPDHRHRHHSASYTPPPLPPHGHHSRREQHTSASPGPHTGVPSHPNHQEFAGQTFSANPSHRPTYGRQPMPGVELSTRMITQPSAYSSDTESIPRPLPPLPPRTHPDHAINMLMTHPPRTNTSAMATTTMMSSHAGSMNLQLTPQPVEVDITRKRYTEFQV